MGQTLRKKVRNSYFRKFSDLRTFRACQMIAVNLVIWGSVLAEARTGDVKMQRVQNALVKAYRGSLSWRVLKTRTDTTALLDKLWKLTEDCLCCLGAANWELVQRRRRHWSLEYLKIMLICVLKKSSLLTLCLETTLPNKSQITIKLPISSWIKIDLGTDPPM